MYLTHLLDLHVATTAAWLAVRHCGTGGWWLVAGRCLRSARWLRPASQAPGSQPVLAGCVLSRFSNQSQPEPGHPRGNRRAVAMEFLRALLDYRFTAKGATLNEIGDRLHTFMSVTPAGYSHPHGQLVLAGFGAWCGLLIFLAVWVWFCPYNPFDLITGGEGVLGVQRPRPVTSARRKRA